MIDHFDYRNVIFMNMDYNI